MKWSRMTMQVCVDGRPSITSTVIFDRSFSEIESIEESMALAGQEMHVSANYRRQPALLDVTVALDDRAENWSAIPIADDSEGHEASVWFFLSGHQVSASAFLT